MSSGGRRLRIAEAIRPFWGSSQRFEPHCSQYTILLKGNFLHVPFRAGTPDQDVVGHRPKLVDDAAGLAHAQPGVRPPQQLSVVIQPVDFSRPIAAVDVLGSDLNGPWRA